MAMLLETINIDNWIFSLLIAGEFFQKRIPQLPVVVVRLGGGGMSA